MKATCAVTARTAGSLARPALLERKWALGALCALLSGCTTNPAPVAPAWPEQPSPSYPDPSGAPDEGSDDLADEAPAQSKQTEGPKASALAKKYDGKSPLDTLEGQASYYADSLAGNHTANGDVYDPKLFTAAHKKLEFGTVVRVVRVDTGAVTYATINDRGPFGDSARIIDLSKAAAQELKMMKAGVVDVRVEIVERPEK